MAITVEEKWDSRQHTEGPSPQITTKWLVLGTDDDLAAKSALYAALPATYDGLVLESYNLDERLAEEAWLGQARYGKLSPPSTGDSTYQFETGGGTEHITQSLETIARHGSENFGLSTAPDFQGAIGVTSDSVEGVDITVPQYQFSETHYFAAAAVSGAYKATLYSLTGRTNDAEFKGFAAGEVLFLGAAGSKRGDDQWEITFRFAARPNQTGLTIGDMTVDKKGWEYLWCRYADAEDGDAGVLVKRPIAVYVERVYESGDFSAMGLS